jgi:hypothetical protein
MLLKATSASSPRRRYRADGEVEIMDLPGDKAPAIQLAARMLGKIAAGASV